MKRGICFTAIGDKAAGGITEGRKSIKEREHIRKCWGDKEEIGNDSERKREK